MAFKRMNRMISFRVSDDEFEKLRVQAAAEGARSVSDYARVALARDSNGERDMMSHLERISAEVQRLTELLDRKGITTS